MFSDLPRPSPLDRCRQFGFSLRLGHDSPPVLSSISNSAYCEAFSHDPLSRDSNCWSARSDYFASMLFAAYLLVRMRSPAHSEDRQRRDEEWVWAIFFPLCWCASLFYYFCGYGAIALPILLIRLLLTTPQPLLLPSFSADPLLLQTLPHFRPLLWKLRSKAPKIVPACARNCRLMAHV